MYLQSVVRIIGIINMVFSVISAAIVGFLFLLIVFKSDDAVEIFHTLATEEGVDIQTVSHSTILVIMWIVLLLAYILSAVQIFASWNLIKGSEREVDSQDGERRCVIWRGITVFVLLLMILNCATWFSGEVSGEQICSEAIFIILYIVALYIVQQYIRQLRLRLPSYQRS